MTLPMKKMRFGFARRPPPRKDGKPPKIPYVATLDGEIIMGFFFKTREAAIAFAEQIARLTK